MEQRTSTGTVVRVRARSIVVARIADARVGKLAQFPAATDRAMTRKTSSVRQTSRIHRTRITGTRICLLLTQRTREPWKTHAYVSRTVVRISTGSVIVTRIWKTEIR